MKTEHFNMSDENYISTMELIITVLCHEKTDKELLDMFSMFDNDEDKIYAIAFVSDIMAEKYKDFLLDTMNCDGGVQ